MKKFKKAFPNWSNFKNWTMPEQIFTGIIVIAGLIAVVAHFIK
jgi:hypothetical protein